jgi:hypothetical protein
MMIQLVYIILLWSDNVSLPELAVSKFKMLQTKELPTGSFVYPSQENKNCIFVLSDGLDDEKKQIPTDNASRMWLRR